jgi:Rps23 Pro-64 3,4-dihydroxylase Tpa1-like proline 4-hydroxylase
VRDVAPIGGMLVVFESVALPHEVLPSTTRERWAASGWFHESQQPEPRERGWIVFT